MYLKSTLLALALSSCVVLAAPYLKRAPAGPQGVDVSGYQPNTDWQAVKANGVEFAYIKATEGATYINPEFANQYNGAYDVGIIRGAYHFAQPADSTGAAQANYFLEHGGKWPNDGKTLPGALDLEYAPEGDKCYGLTPAVMTAWIADFVNTYHTATTRISPIALRRCSYLVIYISTSRWQLCTGNSDAFGANSPLWVARYADAVGELPAGWTGPNPGDQNVFNGDSAALAKLASG
ncbi:hypothetical protein FRC07_013985 [Ceratobasidium sp. 392]|nr:hypothetical protein FRC07_013985 [Ceratobasidium sp. 392]